MKKLCLIILFLCPALLIAQVTKYKITGKIDTHNQQFYAYLYFGNNIKKIKVENERFIFSNAVKAEEKGFTGAILFIDTRSDISTSEIEALKRNGALNSKTNFLRLILEDMDILISNPKMVSDVKFLAGGTLTKITSESENAIKERKVLAFFKKYPDSPVSGFVLKNMVKIRNFPMRKEQNRETFPVEEAYQVLSARLKNTEYVKKIKLDIDKL
jgi:hypothetical protein